MGAVLDMVEYFFFNGKKKQINRPERNQSVDWLDLWKKKSGAFGIEIFFFFS